MHLVESVKAGSGGGSCKDVNRHYSLPNVPSGELQRRRIKKGATTNQKQVYSVWYMSNQNLTQKKR